MRLIKFYVGVILILSCNHASATHIRAGEIIATQIQGNRFQFTFIGYRDVDGVLFGNGTLDLGDGNTFGGPNGEEIPWVRFDPVDGVERWEFTYTHDYAAGSSYLVSYTEDFRNADIQNIAGSVSTSFHVETLVVVDALIPNSTPFFTSEPIDQGVVGAVFEHDPAAFDPDDDSLVFYFVTPKQSSNLDVGGYLPLNDPSFYDNFETGNATRDGVPTLSIDPVEGLLTWDAPGGATIPDMECREWNVAFVVEEWRNINGRPIRLGFVTRDMQIIICDYENEPPELEIPEDTCVVAGETIRGIVTGTDPDGDLVRLEAFGGTFEVNPSATVSPDPPQFQQVPASLEYEWNTACGVVRESPYEVQFKATDSPDVPGIGRVPGQSNFETWRIQVVGPAPQGLEVDAISSRRMSLSWDPYECPNADSIQVWRRVGTFDLNPSCDPGLPETAGYELVHTQVIDDTTYIDNNNTLGLSPGSKYCYRLVATFPPLLGGLSIPSEEACDSLVIDLPVITNVDVRSTDEVTGTIRVNWTPPYQIDPVAFPPVYTYELIRTVGKGPGGTFSSVVSTTDTTFLDSGLNTEDLFYSYRVVLTDGNGVVVDTSQQASSVRLLPNPRVGAIALNWDANIPWSNAVQSSPYHLIYRDNVLTEDPNQLRLIDSVDVTINGFSYLDDGGFNGVELDDEIEYCYFITTRGSYDNELLPEPLINNSQIICAQPSDSIPPCTPISFAFSDDTNFDCETQFSCEDQNQELANVLTWESDNAPECDDDVAFFRVYISRSDDVESFVILGETTGNEFRHDQDIFDRNLPLNSLAFCYYLTAVDRSGNESQISDVICNENCPQYILPNVFTPNDDGVNDTFGPIQRDGQCPRFVESVLFKVFNRAGVEIFTYDSSQQSDGIEGGVSTRNDIFINWDGKTNGGEELPSGVYFYSVEVDFVTLNSNDETEVIKGWVQLIR